MTHDPALDTCGCCLAPGDATPTPVWNTPGRPAVERRVGTLGDFFAAMSAGLTQAEALRRFTDRRLDDPTVALVDAWAAVLDVLTFYSERLTNETYLRTALELDSLTELAHTVGYLPGRGRASATSLAFTLEDALGSPPLVPIPTGTKVASLPGPGEVPQNYETGADLDARPAWNAMPARSRVPQRLTRGATHAHVVGIRTDLAVGDAILVVGSEREGAGASQYWAFRRLASVRPEPGLDATRIGWVEPLGEPAVASGREGDEKIPHHPDLRVFVLRKKAAIFGATAPDWRLISASVGGGRADPTGVAPGTGLGTRSTGPVTGEGPDWQDWSVQVPERPANTVDLDSTYPSAVPGSWVVLSRPTVTACYRIETVTEESRTDYTLNAKVTRLFMQGPWVANLFSSYVRQTVAWVGSELVPLAEAPVELPVQGIEVELADSVPTLAAGRTVVVTGPRPVMRVREGVRDLMLSRADGPSRELHPGDLLEVAGPATANSDGSTTWVTDDGSVTVPRDSLEVVPADPDAAVHSEVAVIAGPTPDEPQVDRLRFAADLSGVYDRTAVRLLGNVAPATHGETTSQVLGGGNATVPFQRFVLAQVPLTYVLASSGGAVLSTLVVRVDGRSWKEVPRLFGAGPHDEVFTTQTDDEGHLTVQFGDGRTGSRLPTGTGNVSATYRIGTGLDGRVEANRLTLPMTRPLGLRSVTNPIASGLAADPESGTEIRANAPRTALTLERVVSLRDVEEFAKSVPGIGKARAAWLWDGRRRFVQLSVVGTGGQSIDATAIDDLTTSLRSAGDPRLPLSVAEAEVVTVHVGIGVVVDPAYEPTSVLDAVIASVTAALTIDARALGQPLTNGDIIVASHAVPGVVAVKVTVPVLDVPSSGAHVVGGVTVPAQLVVLAADGLTVTEVVS